MKILFILLSYCLLPLSHAADKLIFESKQEATTLIELYTSEGCSSCPLADQWLSQLKDNGQLWDTIIPIAFHVDYWDQLGWKDPFASPTNSRRQRQYQFQNRLSSVYTPGLVWRYDHFWCMR